VRRRLPASRHRVAKPTVTEALLPAYLSARERAANSGNAGARVGHLARDARSPSLHVARGPGVLAGIGQRAVT